MDASLTVPEDPRNPDLALLVAMVRHNGRALVGPDPEKLMAEVEEQRLRQALLDVVPGLLKDLDTDTANVLLTLARVAYTLATGEFVSKDAAAAWVLPRLTERSRPALERARDIYVAARANTWDGSEAAVAANELQGVIRAAMRA
jgi:streptomycin 3"-adenylyltransferase